MYQEYPKKQLLFTKGYKMKIRTDFVTNSSSYSSAEIVIDNPVLLEILQKYKDMGTFDPEYSDFSIGNYEYFEDGPLTSNKKITKNPALAVGLFEFSGSWRNVPSSLGEVVEYILSCLEDGDLITDKDLFEQMKSEMENKSDEITAAYKQVIWGHSYTNNEENPEDYNGYITDSENFVFDPAKGEDYHYIRSADAGSDEEVEEGFIYKEKHIINGKVIVDFDVERGVRAEDMESDDEFEDE
jgi:hypothetical protein